MIFMNAPVFKNFHCTDTAFPSIGLPVEEESRSQLWNKAKLTLRYIYRHYLDDYDWFFKADDDT